MNMVALMGRMTAETELKTTNSGKSVVSFTLAVKRRYSKDESDFINCVAWEKTAELISTYVRKGQMIGITGELQSRRYEDKDGNKRTAYEVKVDTVSFAEKRDAQQVVQPISAQQFASAATVEFEEIASDDDLPF